MRDDRVPFVHSMEAKPMKTKLLGALLVSLLLAARFAAIKLCPCGFSEVVRLGVKTLALSEVMSPADMDAMMADAAVIAERNGVLMWRETDFLVTDLYPADVAAGKHVLLIYAGDTKDRYLKIKADKAALVAAGEYEGEAREEIARRFGRLLSYPEAVIDELLSRDKLLE